MSRRRKPRDSPSARKISETMIRSISDIAKNHGLKNSNEESISPMDMISEPCRARLQTRSPFKTVGFSLPARMKKSCVFAARKRS